MVLGLGLFRSTNKLGENYSDSPDYDVSDGVLARGAEGIPSRGVLLQVQ
jgi:hypothetical protein